jgi:hypothetical protein
MSQISKQGTGGGGGGGIIQTIAGDTGTITGAAVTIYAHNSTNNSGASVFFTNSGTVSTLSLTDANDNTFLGNQSGTIGTGAFFSVGVGQRALASAVSGNDNTACGAISLPFLTTGLANTVLGFEAGLNYTGGESNNLLLVNAGDTGESNVIRIGNASQHFSANLAGVTGVTVAASSPVGVNAVGQLSDLGFGTATQVLTSNGAGASPTWQAAGSGAATLLSAVVNSDTTMTQNALVPVPFDSALIDTSGGFASNSYTVPTTGDWRIAFCTEFVSTAGFTLCDVFIFQNGSAIYHGSATITISNPLSAVCNGGFITGLSVGDVISIQAFGQTTGSTDYLASGFANGYFCTMNLELL